VTKELREICGCQFAVWAMLNQVSRERSNPQGISHS
jgi:hypothetical protein